MNKKMNKFQPGENNIAYVSDRFKDYFGDMPVEEAKPLTFTPLRRAMNDYEIQKELNPGEVTLGEVYATLKVIDHDEWNLFYVKDKHGVVCTVGVRWLGGGWDADAGAIDDDTWDPGYRFFSRNSCIDPMTPESDTLAPGILDALHEIRDELRGINKALQLRKFKRKQE